MIRLSLAAVAAALLVPTAASAGGWATVQLSSTPDGARAGVPWNVELTVLQHGVRPLDGISPTIRIWSGAVARTFAATPAGKAGVYRAEVVFPDAGTWRWEIWDGFSQTHAYYPVEVGPAAAPAGGSRAWWGAALGIGSLGVAGLVAAGVVLGRRHPSPRPV